MESSLEYKKFQKSLNSRIRKPRVMIIDDEAIFLDSLKRWLSRRNYEVFTFNNPTVCPVYEKKTGNCMKENPCADIIITDFNMPGMNGFEFLQYQSQRGCKIDKRNKAIVSGYIDYETIEIINKSDYSFFEKPLDLSLMSDWLNECKKRIDLSLPAGSL